MERKQQRGFARRLTAFESVVLAMALMLSGAVGAQTLPYSGTTTTSNPDLSAFKVVNNTNAVGTTSSFRAEGSNGSGSHTGLYSRAQNIGIDTAPTAANMGFGLVASCSTTGSNYCYSIYAVNNSGTGANATAGYFSSSATGIDAVGSGSSATALRATADTSGAYAAKLSSTNGTALHVTASQGQAAYIYASSSAYAAATAEQAGTQPALYAVSINQSGGDAIYAQSATGDGVEARCTGSGCNNGVYGFSSNAGASCVIGQSSSSVQGYGVVGRSWGAGYGVYGDLQSATTGYAGFFQGRAHVNGTLSKLSGSFRIDHPQDPANKFLVHSFVESPEMKNVYDGVVVLEADGTATVQLPSYFEALNENFRYQLTPIGGPASLFIKSEVLRGAFTIAGGPAGLRVSWQVTGTRKDPWAKANPIVVEEEKAPSEKGRYLTPQFAGAGAAALVPGPLHAVPRATIEPSPAPDFTRRYVPAPVRAE